MISVVVALIVVGIHLFRKRAAEQRAAHEMRLRAMAQVALAAARKKKAADAAAQSGTSVPAQPAAPAAPSARDERECPFCAELILKKARLCKHCGREVEPLA